MAKINSIDYAKFGNENYLSFCRELQTITAAFPIVAQRFGYLTTAFAAGVEELDEAMKKQTWSDLTEPIKQKDTARDKVVISFKAMVEGMRHYSPIEGATEDAAKVYRFVKLNHLNPAAQYDKETAQISNLLQDMERYCQAEIQRMGLQPILTEMKRLNDEVAALIAERDIQDSIKKAEAVKLARRKIDGLYLALKDTVNGAALVDTEGLLTPYIDAVNQMLKRLEVQVLKTPTTNPGGSGTTDGTEEEETEEEETTPTTYTATYIHGTETVATQEYEEGETITPPAAPTGYHWVDVPATMPAENLTIHSAEDEEEEEPPILS